MKKLFLTSIAVFAFFMMAVVCKAQTSFSCTERSTCLLDEDLNVVDCINSEEASLFVFNDAETMITHTTDKGKTTYFVHDKEFNSNYDTFIYEVTSDTGNEYLFYIDPDDKSIHVFYSDEDDDIWVVSFKVKAIF